MRGREKCIACGGSLKRWFRRGNFTYIRCTLCGSNSINPIPSEKVILRHYKMKFEKGNYQLLQTFATEYRKVYAQFVDTLTTLYKRNKQTLKGKKVLDVGCFTGEFLELMREEGAHVYGTELQEDAVRIARSKFGNHIFQADIATKKFPAHTFDIISLLGLIEHVTDPEQLLISTAKHLTSEGTLLIQTPNASSFPARWLGKWWPPLAPVEHIHIFSENGLVRLLTRFGFEDIHVYPHVKTLPIAYVYHQFSNFGAHFKPFFLPFGWIVSRLPHTYTLPFYGGEMIVTATRRTNTPS